MTKDNTAFLVGLSVGALSVLILNKGKTRRLVQHFWQPRTSSMQSHILWLMHSLMSYYSRICTAAIENKPPLSLDALLMNVAEQRWTLLEGALEAVALAMATGAPFTLVPVTAINLTLAELETLVEKTQGPNETYR
jgi:hypothetical protein